MRVIQPILPFSTPYANLIKDMYNLPETKRFVLCYYCEYNEEEDNVEYSYVLYAAPENYQNEQIRKIDESRVIRIDNSAYINNEHMQKLASIYAKASLDGFKYNSKSYTVNGSVYSFDCSNAAKYINHHRVILTDEMRKVIKLFIKSCEEKAYKSARPEIIEAWKKVSKLEVKDA